MRLNVACGRQGQIALPLGACGARSRDSHWVPPRSFLPTVGVPSCRCSQGRLHSLSGPVGHAVSVFPAGGVPSCRCMSSADPLTPCLHPHTLATARAQKILVEGTRLAASAAVAGAENENSN